jgi:hypothetical protein
MEMSKLDLVQQLFENIVTVNFIKVNGEERIMKCTLKEDYLPERLEIESKDLIWDDKKNMSKESLSVWDVEAEGWRSFRWNNLKEYNIESA